ncbi:MAG: 1-acyl-sn-glycerol-3-phosphate acyltransferase [Chromatiaceae bacterium]|nr:1-acyl-sn-glycerol-3-phosphate acyltransferase [Gammaproteobacteria bacterium]MCP5305002.1 1-acyl-sn-glycerol-3-phosphate acyltransferase [Chromatiaceae bacterium]MCP5314961.1 1-acyl-sn-glycerol-3-phosphate acyltransferase [Chromatiaceae bacterium]
MILLRSLIYFAVMALSVLIFGLVLTLFGWFLPQGFSDQVATAWGKVNLWLQKVLCDLGYRLHGAENLPQGPCIVMSKHQSTWETIALRGLLRPQQSWVLKIELTRIPVFGWGLRFARSIAIDRSAGRRAVFMVTEQGIERLAEGRCVIIFPEGTRTAPGERRKYGLGGGVLAERSGFDVVPIAHNAGVFWRRRGVKKYPGTIQVVVGKPIPVNGRKAAEIMRDVEDWIETTQASLPMTRDEM